MCTNQGTIEAAFVCYFQDLFTAGANLNVADCIWHVQSRGTTQMNNRLLEEFTIEEISQTLQQMAPLKAPGPDGFSVCFYQQNWDTVHAEVNYDVLHFLNTRKLNPEINATNLALVPKVFSPTCVTDF